MTPPVCVGKYWVERRLPGGGMADLYLAHDPDLGRLVAIKVLRDNAATPGLRVRFQREARLLAAMRHPNIVVVFEGGEHDGLPYIVMEYLRGETLAQLLDRGARVPLARTLAIVEDVCAGLAEAHRAAIVHRDIKPANVMVEPDGTVKVLDFGIARTRDASLTQHDTILGTFSYMSPEQMAGSDVDARTDIFALGVVLYELIAGRPAFRGDTAAHLRRALGGGSPGASAVDPETAKEVALIVATAMQREPADRYQTVGAMQTALRAVRLSLGETGAATQHSRRAANVDAAPTVVRAGGHGLQRQQATPPGRRRAAGAAALSCVLGAVLLVRFPARWSEWSGPRVGRVAESLLPSARHHVVAMTTGPAVSVIRAHESAAFPWPMASREIAQHPPARMSRLDQRSQESSRESRSAIDVPVGTGRAAGGTPLDDRPAGRPLDEGDASATSDDVGQLDRARAVDVTPTVTSDPPAGAAPANRSTDAQAVRAAIFEYVGALSARSVTAMARLRVMDAELQQQLQAQFDNLNGWRVAVYRLSSMVIGLDGHRASVTATLTYNDVEYRGRVGRHHLPDRTFVFVLERRDGGDWRITQMVAER